MGPVRLRNRTLAGLFWLASVACHEGDATPPIVWEGEHLRFGTDEDLSSLCAGTLPFADGFVGFLNERFDREQQVVDYYWTPEGLVEPCEDITLGCSFGSVAYGRIPLIQHELTHAVRGDDDASPPLEEGLAELFGDDWVPDDPLSSPVSLMFESYDRGTRLPSSYYPTAGHFSSFLRAQYGEASLLEFVEISEQEDSWEQTMDRFQASFGFPIDDAFDAYEEYPECDRTMYRANGFECGQSPRMLSTIPYERVDVDVVMSCDEDGVVGPRQNERWTTVVLEVPLDGFYNVEFAKIGGQAPGRIRFRECDQSCLVRDEDHPFVFDLAVESQAQRDEAFSPMGEFCIWSGRYLVRLAVDADDEGDFLLQFERTSDGPQPCTP